MAVRKILKTLETKQLLHDVRYHQDIWTLNTQSKARHMAAHIGKYSGQLLDSIRGTDSDSDIIQKYIIDSLIINFSYANIFLGLLSNKLDENYLNQKDFKELINTVGFSYLTSKGYSLNNGSALDLAMDMCILAGKILKTVESLDHVEKHDFRQNFESYSIDLFEILLALCYVYNIYEVVQLIENRLFSVEQKNPYFKLYGNYKNGYQSEVSNVLEW
ncbi:hypothetical protein NK318_01165 [Acinetobacter junii]|uniref:hypothetical protein n=1 Tax=Acinetobacter junii TaxID=40215 RepID=UPI0030956631